MITKFAVFDPKKGNMEKNRGEGAICIFRTKFQVYIPSRFREIAVDGMTHRSDCIIAHRQQKTWHLLTVMRIG